MSRIIAALFIFLALACAGHAKAGEELKPEDFAYGLPLETGEGGAIFEVSLPLDFYRGVTRADLGDMGVFNRAGEMVPFAVRQPSPEMPETAAATLPVFPIPGEAGRSPESLSLRVRRDSAGTIVHLDRSGPSTAEAGTIAYLLDASALKQPVKGLVLEWDPSEQGFVGRVAVEGSDDLESWSAVGSTAVVASLHYGEHSLVRNRIALAPTSRKYLRIAWPSALRQVKLVKIGAELAGPAPEPPRNAVSVSAAVNKDRPGEYLFQSPGPIPVDRLRVGLPGKNTLVSAELLSRENEKSPWKTRASGLIYDLRLEGADVVSTELAMTPMTDRFWMLRVHQGGGGLGQGMPVLELGWVPQNLLFVARGEGPFLLAFGNARRPLAGTRVDDLLTQFSKSRQEQIAFGRATFGPRVELGGEGKLKASPVDPKKAVLWGVLVLGVLVLAWMAVRLFRQMNRRNGEGQ